MYQTVVTNVDGAVPVMQTVCSSSDSGTGTTVIQVESGQVATSNSTEHTTNQKVTTSC